ncbi:MAG: PASTA domain-containing protein [Candidatus Hydrogenedentes bacterium]|nr:PASTA domain-containing protein [Candidatus Hydrogenedentota bacterium]
MLRFIAWSVQWSVAMAVFLLVMAGAGWYVYNYALGGGQHVTVPAVTDLPVTEAAYVLGERGLELGRQTQVPHPTVPKYYVITQKPAAGRVVRTGRRVDTVVSMGQDFLRTPDLRGAQLEEARRAVTEGRFRLGSLARIPSDAPRDTVLAQDPPPGGELSSQSEIHLLLSAGNTRASALMPDLRGTAVAELESALAPFGVTLVANPVDIPDAPYDVVLNQNPPPDSLVYPNQVVTYDYRPSQQAQAPSERYQAHVRHEMGYDWYGRDVRVDVVDRAGNRQTVWSKQPSFDQESQATYLAGTAIRLPVTYIQEAMVEVYVDNRLEASYRLQGGAEPVRARGPENQ